ncbi:MAG TPA: GNAT family N-acetyltransferase [Planctomycetota bacterium]|nr:GNAT family N-acetyltransferase [Planctomycetota bacterium]
MDAWRSREPRESDRSELVRVFNAAFRRDDPSSVLGWRYDRNPHGRALTRIAVDEADRLVGAYSFAPRRFVVEGRSVAVLQASDAMVFPEWQRRGIFARLDEELSAEAASAGFPFAFAFCGRRSRKTFLANGWRPIAPYRTWTRVLRAARPAFEARRSDGRLRRALVPLEALSARAADRGIRRALEGFDDRPVDRFGDEVARFPAPAQRIFGERDAAWLNWRYLETPRRAHRPFRLLRRGEVVGFYDVECAGGRGWLLDARGADDACARAALAAAVERLRALGAAAIQTTVVEGSYLDGRVADLGFRPPRDREPLPFIVRVLHAGAASDAALDASSWYVLDGDRDAEGMS